MYTFFVSDKQQHPAPVERRGRSKFEKHAGKKGARIFPAPLQEPNQDKAQVCTADRNQDKAQICTDDGWLTSVALLSANIAKLRLYIYTQFNIHYFRSMHVTGFAFQRSHAHALGVKSVQPPAVKSEQEPVWHRCGVAMPATSGI